MRRSWTGLRSLAVIIALALIAYLNLPPPLFGSHFVRELLQSSLLCLRRPSSRPHLCTLTFLRPAWVSLKAFFASAAPFVDGTGLPSLPIWARMRL